MFSLYVTVCAIFSGNVHDRDLDLYNEARSSVITQSKGHTWLSMLAITLAVPVYNFPMCSIRIFELEYEGQGR